jgi:hypothetical protein
MNEKQEMKMEKEKEAADLWVGHIVARRSQVAADMLPPRSAWPAQISGRRHPRLFMR